MIPHYDHALRSKLPATTTGSGVLLNAAFQEWGDHIILNLHNRSSLRGDSTYRRGTARQLFERCREHADAYQKPIQESNVIILTHPLYLHLSYMHHLKNSECRREASEYADMILSFLRSVKDQDQLKVVILETLHHYAAATSLLVEQGLVGRVVFTQYDTGYPCDPDELRPYAGKNIYFGGGYNNYCLTHSIGCMKGIAGSSKKIWAVHDLVLNGQLKNARTLKPLTIKGLPRKKTISLDEMVKRLKGKI